MGASRDFTTGHDSSASTALLERGVHTERRASRRHVSDGVVSTSAFAPSAPQRPSRTDRPVRRTGRPDGGRDRRGGGRLGSKQVVSVRGRRTAPIQANSKLPRLSFISLALLIGGVVMAMWLSGQSTIQTFEIQNLASQEKQLDNQIETLNRDLENVRSSADVVRRASENGLAVPTNPGIVAEGKDGKVQVKRQATPETDRIVDINGAPIRPGKASSDPEDTGDVSDEVSAIPQSNRGSSERPAEGGASRGDNSARGNGDNSANRQRAGEQSQDLPYAPSVSE